MGGTFNVSISKAIKSAAYYYISSFIQLRLIVIHYAHIKKGRQMKINKTRTK